MARPKGAPPGNRKLTDYFSRSSQAGSSQPPSSPPVPSQSSTKQGFRPLSQQQKPPFSSQPRPPRTAVNASKTIGASASKATSKATTTCNSTPTLSIPRSVKIEPIDLTTRKIPYPTPTTPSRRVQELDVISISSGTPSEKSHITIISISSTSSSLAPIAVFDSANRPPVASSSTSKLKPAPAQQNIKPRMRAQASLPSSSVAVDANVSSDSLGPLRRKSPRLNAQSRLSSAFVKQEPPLTQQLSTPTTVMTSTPRKGKGKSSGRKRKSEFSDDENLDLKGAKDVIVTAKYVANKSQKGTPKVASTHNPSPSPSKKSKLSHDIRDTSSTLPPTTTAVAAASATASKGPHRETSVIPTSQSDEQELVLPRDKGAQKKDFKEVQEAVLAWRTSSQQSSGAVDWSFGADVDDTTGVDVKKNAGEGVEFGDDAGVDADVEVDMRLGSSSMQISEDDMDMSHVSKQIPTSPLSSIAPPVPSSPWRCNSPATGGDNPSESSPFKTPTRTPTRGARRAEVVVTPLSALMSARRKQDDRESPGIRTAEVGTRTRGSVSHSTATTTASSMTKVSSSPVMMAMKKGTPASLPSSPKIELLDEKSKTAAIIAKIEAEVKRNKRLDVDDDDDDDDKAKESRVLRSLDNDSDEDLTFDLVGALRGANANAKGKAKVESPALDTDDDTVDSRPAKRRRSRGGQHTSARDVSPSPSLTASSSTGMRRKSARLSAITRDDRKPLSAALSAKVEKSSTQAPAKAAPFAALLREKNLKAKRLEKQGIAVGKSTEERMEATQRALRLGERWLRGSSEEGSPGPSNGGSQLKSPSARGKMPSKGGEFAHEDDSDADVDGDGDGDRTFEDVLDVAKRAQIFKKGRKSGCAEDGDEGMDEEAMGRILRDDRAERGKRDRKGKGREQECEVALWPDVGEEKGKNKCEGEDVSADTLPELELDEHEETASKDVELLKKCIAEGNVKGIAALLQFGRLLEDTSCQGEVLAWVFDLALTTAPLFQSLAQTAYTALTNLCLYADELLTADVSPIRFESIYFALNQLGAKPEVLEKLCERFEPAKTVKRVDAELRDVVLWRMVELVETCAGARLLCPDDIPEIISALLLCGHDPSASEELKIGVSHAVEKVINMYCKDSSVRGEMETQVCKKVVGITREYDVEDKVSILKLIPGGSYLARRVAQWIAFGYMCVDKYEDMLNDCSNILPPLHLVIAKLCNITAPAASQQQHVSTPSSSQLSRSVTAVPTSVLVFDVTRVGNVDTTDYAQLEGSIEILSEVLTNVHVYAAMEKFEKPEDESMLTPKESPMKATRDGDKAKSSAPLPKLSVVVQILQSLGGKIVDTRGVALDRSRTKATIQRLQMRIYYQRQAAISSGRPPADGKITTFWESKLKGN